MAWELKPRANEGIIFFIFNYPNLHQLTVPQVVLWLRISSDGVAIGGIFYLQLSAPSSTISRS